jgi:hypothetical protein
LKIEYDEPLSNFAYKFNFPRYSVVSTPDSRNIYAVGSDKKLKEFDETNQISKVGRCSLTPG